MVKLLVLPADLLEHFRNDGVQLTKLLDINYMSSVASVSDLAAIHDAINKFPFKFCSATKVELADSPVTGLMQLASGVGVTNPKMQDLHNRVEGRITNNALTKALHPSLECYEYSLYPVDENLWVAVQKSLHTGNGDPARLSIKANRALFDDMIGELMRTRTFESVASTNLFTYYLEALQAK
jgi:hypothetical protein